MTVNIGDLLRRRAHHDPDHEALRPGNSQFRFHPLGRRLQAVADAPDHPHELEDIPKGRLVATVGSRLAHRTICSSSHMGPSVTTRPDTDTTGRSTWP